MGDVMSSMKKKKKRTSEEKFSKLWRLPKFSDEIISVLIHVLSFDLITELTGKHQNWAQKDTRPHTGLAWKSGNVDRQYVFLNSAGPQIPTNSRESQPPVKSKTLAVNGFTIPNETKLFLCIKYLSMMKAWLGVIYPLLYLYHSNTPPVWGSSPNTKEVSMLSSQIVSKSMNTCMLNIKMLHQLFMIEYEFWILAIRLEQIISVFDKSNPPYPQLHQMQT